MNPASPLARPADAPPTSALSASAAQRLGVAAGLAALLWLAVAWALA
jgi:hypothetical protein